MDVFNLPRIGRDLTSTLCASSYTKDRKLYISLRLHSWGLSCSVYFELDLPILYGVLLSSIHCMDRGCGSDCALFGFLSTLHQSKEARLR